MVGPSTAHVQFNRSDTPSNSASNFQSDFGCPTPPAKSLDLLEPPAPQQTPAQSGPSWVLEADPGAYREIPGWSSPDAWLAALTEAVDSPEGESARARARVARGTLLGVALADRTAADPRSGRGVCTSHATVARKLGLKSGRTVKRARDLMVALGFAAVIAVGRHLDRSERAQARARHGRAQDRAASLRALTMPRPAANVTPSRRDSSDRRSQALNTHSNQRATARAARRNPPQAPLPRKTAHKVWPREEFLFARDVQRRLPALLGFHTATVCAMLASLGITAARWHSAAFLLGALEHGNRARGGWDFAPPARQRRPLAYTRHVLAASLDLAAETPYEAAERRRAELRAERDAAREAAASRRAASSDTAAEAFFEGQRRLYGRRPAGAGAARRPEAGRIVACVLGPGAALYDAPEEAQMLCGDLQTAARALRAAGWRLARAEPGSGVMAWEGRDAAGAPLSLEVDVSGPRAAVGEGVLREAGGAPGSPAGLLAALQGRVTACGRGVPAGRGPAGPGRGGPGCTAPLASRPRP